MLVHCLVGKALVNGFMYVYKGFIFNYGSSRTTILEYGSIMKLMEVGFVIDGTL